MIQLDLHDWEASDLHSAPLLDHKLSSWVPRNGYRKPQAARAEGEEAYEEKGRGDYGSASLGSQII